MVRISLRGLLLIVTLAFVNETAIDGAQARPSFNGAGGVVITTDSGTCDPANRLSIDIRDGILQYIGDSPVLIRGRVASNGLVHVRVGSGNLRASGSGSLSANSGTGTWRGSNSASSCTGRWSAERR
jgi:hypothetical protein